MGLFDGLVKKKQKNLSSVKENESFKSEPQEKKAADNSCENIDGPALLERHENGLINDDAFLQSFSKANVFYSTPFGNHKDGNSRLFILPAHENNTAFLPVFSSAERAAEFFEKSGRVGYLIIEGTFASFLETTHKMNMGKTPIKLGAVIDPGYFGVTMGVGMIDAVVNMTK